MPEKCQSRRFGCEPVTSGLHPTPDASPRRYGRVEDGRGSLSHSATLRFPSPLIEPDVPISGIRLSDWLHREVHGEQTNRARLRHGE
jgi:hypothetical protein